MGELATTTVNIDELKRVGIIAQNQKDMFLIRLRTVGGDLNAEELRVITRVSQKYGRGAVHLTTRQAVEIPFVHVDDLEAAREELKEGGIVLGVCGPRGRGIVACPGTTVCTSAIVETKELAAELDSAYFRQPAPHKFKIGVSGCPNSCSKPIENDVGVMGGVLPAWDREACISCRLCVTICPVNAIEETELGLRPRREKVHLLRSLHQELLYLGMDREEDRLHPAPRRHAGQETPARDPGKRADRDEGGIARPR